MNKILVVLLALFVAMPVTAGAVLIDFSTTQGFTLAAINLAYIGDGVTFSSGLSGTDPIATTDDWSFVGGSGTQTVLQVVAGSEVSQTGDFWINFVNPAQNVSFDSGIWQTEGVGEVTVYYTNFTKIYYNDGSTYPEPFLQSFSFNEYSGLVNQIYFNNASNSASFPAGITNLSFEIVAAPIPEPGTMLLLGSGLLGLIPYGRKRRKR